MQAVKRSLEREKDLEGIDMSNIVSDTRRRGRREAAAKPVNYKTSYKCVGVLTLTRWSSCPGLPSMPACSMHLPER